MLTALVPAVIVLDTAFIVWLTCFIVPVTLLVIDDKSVNREDIPVLLLLPVIDELSVLALVRLYLFRTVDRLVPVMRSANDPVILEDPLIVADCDPVCNGPSTNAVDLAGVIFVAVGSDILVIALAADAIFVLPKILPVRPLIPFARPVAVLLNADVKDVIDLAIEFT